MKKLRCVIDTNVLVSALLVKRTLPFQVVEWIFTAGIILRSEATSSELMEVLGRKKFDKYITTEERQVFFSKFLVASELVNVKVGVEACRDPRDDKFLAVGVNGNADLIISGDDDLLSLHPFRGIQILSPQAFLMIAKGSENK